MRLYINSEADQVNIGPTTMKTFFLPLSLSSPFLVIWFLSTGLPTTSDLLSAASSLLLSSPVTTWQT